MYISVKSGEEAKNLVATLVAHNVETDFRENKFISFIDADLESSNLFAILRVYANQLLIFESGIDAKDVCSFPLDKIDCIYNL